MKNTFIAALSAILLSFSHLSSANLISNGSFEDIGSSAAIGGYGRASTWQIYSSIPGWDSTQNLEIWSNDFIVPAYDGNRVLELNAHPANANGQFSIFQSFSTIAGQSYELSFFGHRRHAHRNEAFKVEVGDLVDSIYNQTARQWNAYTYQFTATSSLSTLTFTSLDGGRDTTGNILDDVKVTAVYEPGSFVLLMSGLLCLIFARRRG